MCLSFCHHLCSTFDCLPDPSSFASVPISRSVMLWLTTILPSVYVPFVLICNYCYIQILSANDNLWHNPQATSNYFCTVKIQSGLTFNVNCQNEGPEYNIKQSDGEVLAFEIWKMWNIPSFLFLTGLLWPEW